MFKNGEQHSLLIKQRKQTAFSLIKQPENTIRLLPLEIYWSLVVYYRMSLMKFGRTDSLGQPFHFFRIKDLHFFRHLLWRYDLSLIKDYLHNSLTIIPIDPFLIQQLDKDHIYVPNQQAHIQLGENGEKITIRSGHAFPEGIAQFTSMSSFALYRISKKTVFILEKLYFLDVPLMNGMKSSEKFSFLERCQVLSLNFNSFVYRRGEEVEAIYYLLEGQIKLFKELGENVYEIASLEKGRIFGLFEVKSKAKSRELYAKASLNQTVIMKISTKLMEKICLEREVTMDMLLNDAKSELYSVMKSQTQRRPFVQKTEKDAKNFDSTSRALLERRLKTFQSNRMIKSSVIENLVYSKKMLFRVKELNEKMQTNNNKSTLLQSQNPHAIRHFNDKWKFQKDKNKAERPEKVRTSVATARSPFKRLLKYPSVQRYLNLQTSHMSQSKVDIDLP